MVILKMTKIFLFFFRKKKSFGIKGKFKILYKKVRDINVIVSLLTFKI